MSEELIIALLHRCESMEIPIVGVANVERWSETAAAHPAASNLVLATGKL